MDKRSLIEFAANEGFRSNAGTTDSAKLLTVGVDARYELAPVHAGCSSHCETGSMWMHSACPVFRYNHAGVGVNPELRTLFYWLSALLKIPLHVVFVFNGPAQPHVKRRKQIWRPRHWLASAFQEMLTIFGFAWYEVHAYMPLYYVGMTQTVRRDPAKLKQSLRCSPEMDSLMQS